MLCVISSSRAKAMYVVITIICCTSELNCGVALNYQFKQVINPIVRLTPARPTRNLLLAEYIRFNAACGFVRYREERREREFYLIHLQEKDLSLLWKDFRKLWTPKVFFLIILFLQIYKQKFKLYKCTNKNLSINTIISFNYIPDFTAILNSSNSICLQL